jgi:hypothetical protein
VCDEVLELSADAGLTLVAFDAESGSPSHARHNLLAG